MSLKKNVVSVFTHCISKNISGHWTALEVGRYRLLSFKASVQSVEFVFVTPALHSICIQHNDSVSSLCLI